ncbi:MAG: hypothetical protein AAF713_19150 [Pseudomonadota bacterium]
MSRFDTAITMVTVLSAADALLAEIGIAEGRMKLRDFTRPTAANHVKTYGLSRRRGSIAVGADAHQMLWSPVREEKIRQHVAKGTRYERVAVAGWPVPTTRRCRHGGTEIEATGGHLARGGSARSSA